MLRNSLVVNNKDDDLETICTIGEMIDLQDTRLSQLTYESKDLQEVYDRLFFLCKERERNE